MWNAGLNERKPPAGDPQGAVLVFGATSTGATLRPVRVGFRSRYILLRGNLLNKSIKSTTYDLLTFDAKHGIFELLVYASEHPLKLQ